MDDYVLFIETKRGDCFSLEGIALKGIKFPEFPIGGEKIVVNDSPELIDYYKMRASPWEELQKRFSNKTYVIKEIRFGERNVIFAFED